VRPLVDLSADLPSILPRYWNRHSALLPDSASLD
jgi:hypothetical protein